MNLDLAPADGTGWQRFAAHLRAARERLYNFQLGDPSLPAFAEGLAGVEALLRRPLRIVVLGEGNSGKTSVVDLVLGKGFLPTSVVANTGVPVLVQYAAEPAIYGIEQDGTPISLGAGLGDRPPDRPFHAVGIRLPLPWLREHDILDTPATELPTDHTARADILLWCTVATRAWTESERMLWSNVPLRFRDTAILVATHEDNLFSTEDCDQVLRRLSAMTKDLFRDAMLVSTVLPTSGGDQRKAGDTAALRAAIEQSAQIVRGRRLERAKRIAAVLARRALHDLGTEDIQADGEATFGEWKSATDAVLDRHRSGRQTAESTVRDILHAFATAAGQLQPGVIRAGVPDGHAAALNAAPPRSFARPGSAVMLRADLTAVLRILASQSSFEAPDLREQRQAARAMLLSFAGLDAVFADLDRWLVTANPGETVPQSPRAGS